MTIVKGIVWDQDGTAMDTETLYRAFFTMMAAKERIKFDPLSILRRRVLGVDWKRIVIPDMINTLGLSFSADEYDAWSIAFFEAMAPFSELLPGAERLINHFSHHQIPIAIATSCDKVRVASTWQSYPDLLKKFQVVVSGDDPEVKNGKPAPDLLLVTAQRLNLSAQECVYVGDNPADMQAADAAGMPFVAVPNYLQTPEVFAGSFAIIDSLEDFPLEQLGLPTW